MRSLLLCLVLVAPAALAQSEPPLVPVPPEPSEPSAAPTYFQRCFAMPAQVWIPHSRGGFYSVSPVTTPAPLSSFHGATPVPADAPTSSGSSSSSSSGGGSLGGGDAKALLVLAVVVVAVLPLIVYAVDEDAPAVVEQRFHCPTFGFDLMGGADFVGPAVAPRGTGRFTFGYSYFGADLQFDYSAGSVDSFAGHFMLRISPKQHIEPNLAFGYRLMTFGGRTRQGLEVGVPHRYVFWRQALQQFALELRPTLAFGLGSFDAGLEFALLFSVAEPLQLRLGGKVQSFGDDVLGGIHGGVTFVF